jgi:hypothetical protein
MSDLPQQEGLGSIFDRALRTAEELGRTDLPMELIAQRLRTAERAGIADSDRLFEIALTGV